MFAYPPQAAVNRPVAKAKIYAHARPSKRIKELFVAQVGEIVWKYKLSPETINLPAYRGINEIQVFEIALKSAELDDGVLQTIDKAIPFPLVFQITHARQVRYCASYKRPSESDPSRWVIEALLQTDWQPAEVNQPPLPVVLDLASLHDQILRRHIPLPPRAGEGIAEHIARFNSLQASRKRQLQLQARLTQEKQFNRKVEINSQLRELKLKLADLQS